MRPILSMILMCVLALSFTSLPAGTEPADGGPPVAAAVAEQGAEWGTIKGKIIWGGDKIPPRADIKLPAGNPDNAACLQANKGLPPPDETWIVNKKNKGIKNTFVWLADADKKPLPINPKLQGVKLGDVVIDQPACHFIPHAIAIREGQKVIVKNSSTFQHNFKYNGSPTTKNSGNILLPPGGQLPLMLETDRLPIKVECSIHTWMNGWIRVYDHPYFAVTDASGDFEIKDAPAGNFRLMVWHGSAGWKGGAKGKNGDPVEIKAGAVTDLGGISFPPPD